MFYRRKILLALIEAFGGSLKKTDCQKLLFLFCKRRGKDYYDFFPHRYGSYSVILAQDENRLSDLGLLTLQESIQLQGEQSYLDQIEKKDQQILQSLVAEVGDVRGPKLIHKIYLEYPHYTYRSRIAKEVLSDEEYEQVSRTWNTDSSPCLFTIGYEGLSIDAYLDLLISHNVKMLVDVRKNPISMKYGFSKTQLMNYTKVAGIKYLHIADLGIPSSLRKDLSTAESYEKLFDHYFTHILPEHIGALIHLKDLVASNGRVAITCFEADHNFCHRHKITEYLENDPTFDIAIEHLHKEHLLAKDTQKAATQHGLWS